MGFNRPRQLALFSLLASACIGIQLTPRPPNVEFTSLIAFIIGVFFGSHVGGVFGAVVMFINGFFSPWGMAGLIMPFQMAGMFIIGVAGGIFGRSEIRKSYVSLYSEAAILGAFLTLLYDIITNIGVAVLSALAGTPLTVALITAFAMGAFFSLIHITSNLFIFGLLLIPLSNSMKNFMGGEKSW